MVLSEDEYKVLSNSGTFPFIKIKNHISFITKIKEKTTTVITENGYQSLQKDDKYLLITICDYFMIKRKIFWSDDSSPPNIEIEFLNKSEIFECTVVTKSGIELLVNNGITINTRYIDKILDYMFISLNRAEIHYQHKMLGFYNQEGIDVFRHYNLISPSDTIAQSEYHSILDIKPTGSYEQWLKMIEDEVSGNEKLELILSIAFSAALIGFLGKDVCDLNSIFQLVGDSSSGKSTAMALAVSVYSSPIISRGLMKTFNATDNSIQKCMERNNSVVIGFDEGGMRNKDFTNLIYTLASGASKMRLTGDGEFKEICTWQNICLTTSEYNLLEQSDKKTGLSVRCIEISSPFTSSAENSEKIMNCIKNNYAVAIEPFVKKLFEMGKENLTSLFYKAKTTLYDNHKKCSKHQSVLDERIVRTLTPIIVSAEICKDMGMKISPSNVETQLLEISIKVCDKENSIENVAINTIKCFIERNLNRVLLPNDDIIIDGIKRRNCIARLHKRKNNSDFQLLDILRDEFDNLMRENNLSPKVVKRKLKEKGLLKTEKGRLDKRLKLGDFPYAIPCCQIVLHND